MPHIHTTVSLFSSSVTFLLTEVLDSVIDFRHTGQVLLGVALALLTLLQLTPNKLRAEPSLLSELLKGTEQGYLLPGYELASLKDKLPPQGAFSLISDVPFNEDKKNWERLQIAQNYLAPLLLNPKPVEALGIAYCTSHDIALKRAAETGYRFVYDSGGGRGLLAKKI